MENLRYLLAAITALTLIMSVVSTVNPSYFADFNAFADDHEGDDGKMVQSLGDNSEAELEIDDDDAELKVEIEDGDLDDGTYDVAFMCESPDVDEEFAGALEVDDGEGEFEEDLVLPSGTYSGCEVVVGELHAAFASFKIMANDDEDEEDEEDNDNDKDDEDEQKMTETLGNNSRVVLEVDEDAELQIEIEDGDLDDGTYNVEFACDSPDFDKEFQDVLTVEDGDGEFKEDLSLTNGTYSGCEVEVGGLAATFASLTIAADNDDDHKDRKNELKKEFKLEADGDGVEIEIKAEDLDMEDGSHDAVFACEAPAFNITLDDAFEVEDGEGEFEEMIGLANGTYSGCEITVDGTVLASFRAFTISEESEDEQEQRIEEKRKERRESIINSVNGTTIHERHRSQNPASPGDYDPGWDYALIAAGTAAPDSSNRTDGTDAEIDINMAVWKSNSAVILLDVIDGTVEIENQIYTVVLGYALYTTQHDVFRVSALAVDDDGNVYKLKLRGNAVDGIAEFPTESGSIELAFEGNGGPADRLGDWELAVDGTVTAG